MKKSLLTSLNVLLIVLLASLVYSCDFITNKDSYIAGQFLNAKNNLKKHPDSTIIIANKLIKKSLKNTVNEEEQLALFQLKYHAFLKLKKMDSVYVTGEKIRDVAARIPDSLAIAETLIQLYGNVDYKYLKEVKEYLPSAIKTFEKNNKLYERGIVNALYGVILRNEGDFMKSQNYFLKALQILEPTDSIKAIGRIYTSLGNNFASVKIMDKSTFYYRKALKIAENKKDSLFQASILLNLGINYKIKNPDSTVIIYNRALKLLPVNKENKLRMQVEYNLANIYFNKREYSKAEDSYKRILDVAIKTNYQEGIVMSTAALGNVYGAQKKYELSINYYKKALKILQGNNQKDVILMLLPELIDVYKNSGNSKMAMYYYDQILALKDSLLTIEKTKSILELEKKYQTEKKASEIVYLKSLSNSRLLMLYGLCFFVIVLFFVLKKQKKLYREKQNSYALLMQQYKSERLEKLGVKGTITAHASAVTENLTKEDQCLFAKLTEYYENEKPYLNSKLKATEIAKVLQVPQRTISATLKVNGYSSFNNFNNKYRIEEVKKIFEDPNSEVLKMEVIASQAGFGNKQSFYLAFEEYTGLNPGFYRSEILK